MSPKIAAIASRLLNNVNQVLVAMLGNSLRVVGLITLLGASIASFLYGIPDDIFEIFMVSWVPSQNLGQSIQVMNEYF